MPGRDAGCTTRLRSAYAIIQMKTKNYPSIKSKNIVTWRNNTYIMCFITKPCDPKRGPGTRYHADHTLDHPPKKKRGGKKPETTMRTDVYLGVSNG